MKIVPTCHGETPSAIVKSTKVLLLAFLKVIKYIQFFFYSQFINLFCFYWQCLLGNTFTTLTNIHSLNDLSSEVTNMRDVKWKIRKKKESEALHVRDLEGLPENDHGRGLFAKIYVPSKTIITGYPCQLLDPKKPPKQNIQEQYTVQVSFSLFFYYVSKLWGWLMGVGYFFAYIK